MGTPGDVARRAGRVSRASPRASERCGTVRTSDDTVSDDPYAVLGVARDVSEVELRAARRRAALRSHPDHEGGSTDEMRRLNAAFDAILADVTRRAADRPEPAVPTGPSPAPPAPPAPSERVPRTGSRLSPRRRLVHDRGAAGRGVRGAARRGDLARRRRRRRPALPARRRARRAARVLVPARAAARRRRQHGRRHARRDRRRRRCPTSTSSATPGSARRSTATATRPGVPDRGEPAVGLGGSEARWP